MLSATEIAMLEARADLGNHRMAALPLGGKVVPQWQLSMIKPIDLNQVKDEIASWHTALREEDETTIVRDDGIGSGNLHRLGPNFRPGSARIFSAPAGPGALIAKGRRSRGVRRTARTNTQRRNFNTNAIYPMSRPKATINAATQVRDEISKRPHVSTSASATIASLAKADLGPKQVFSDPTNMQNFNNSATKLDARFSGTSKDRLKTLDRPAYPAAKLVDQPFWLQGSSTRLNSAKQVNDIKKTNVTNAMPQRIVAAPVSTATIVGTDSKHVTGITKLSSKGFLQDLPAAVPSHYRQVVFPPREIKPIDATKSESESDHESDVYSDPELSTTTKAARTVLDTASTSDSMSLKQLISRLESSALEISSTLEDDVEAPEPSSSSVPRAENAENVGLFLFTLNFGDFSWPVHEFDEPSQIAHKVCQRLGITSDTDHNDIRRQIVTKFDKNLAKMRLKMKKSVQLKSSN